MIRAALVLAALVAPAAAASLDEAQAAFARQDYEQAEALAQAVAHPPQEGAALYLIGLSLFRRGQPAQALESLQRANRAEDPPAPALWHYNVSACLYDLERYLEAEAEALDAASLDAAVAPIALVNAGWAALDGGSPQRARVWAARARDLAGREADALLEDLDKRLASSIEAQAKAEYREGLEAFDAGRFGDALGRFRRAAELDPRDGRSHIMSGASALQLGARSEARLDLERALALPLDERDAQTARDYLAAANPLAAPRAWEATLRAAGGADSNALQTGLYQGSDRPETSTSTVASAAASGGLSIVLHRWFDETTRTDLGYAFDQVAYLNPDAADRSLQVHDLALSLETVPHDRVRLGARAQGQLLFTGLSNFRAMQGSGGLGAWAALAETSETATRLDLDWTRKTGVGDEFSYLSGDRFDAAVSQDLRWGPAAFALGVRLRAELIGSTYQSVATRPGRGPCSSGCTEDVTVPYDYLGSAFWLSTRTALGRWFLLDVSGGLELRKYLTDSTYQVTTGDGIVVAADSSQRNDQRWFGTAALTLRLPRGFSLALTYDLVVNRSDQSSASANDRDDCCGASGATCSQLDYDKHVVALGTAFTW